MDPCLHLALLESSYDSDLVDEVRDLPDEERKLRYAELIAEKVPADADEASWTDEADLFEALPDGADDTIRSLAGIETYPELQSLYLRESEVGDLGPLATLPDLELLWLGVTPQADLTPLLSCDQLQRVHIDCDDLLGTAADAVLRLLAARGVQVDSLLPDPVQAAAPFADPILKLAVLDALQKSIDLPTTYFFDEYSFDRDNLARLMTVEIPQEQLDSIETLAWLGGGHATAHMVWAQWDGESDEFNFRSLAGIEALRNLTKLAVSPLDVLPTDQVAALRARGVTVQNWPA